MFASLRCNVPCPNSRVWMLPPRPLYYLCVVRHCKCHGTCQLGLDPWRRQECGRKECGVMPSRRMECGVTPSGRRISLIEAVTHFFLSFFLFLRHATTCFLSFLIEEPHFLSHTSLSPRAVHSLRAALVLSPLRVVCSPPPLSSPRCAPSARHHPCPVPAERRLVAAAFILSPLRAFCSPPPLSSPRYAPSARRRPCPVPAARRQLAAALALSSPPAVR